MTLILILYNLFLPVALAASKVLALFDRKISRTIKARKGIIKRWHLAAEAIDRETPLIWVHVSSVGEYLQIKPVLDILGETGDDSFQVALTFYSPSGYEFFEKHDGAEKGRLIRFVEYLPFDSIDNVRSCLDILRPGLIVFVRYDLWPNLVSESAKKKIPQITVSASVGSGRKRFYGIKRRFYMRLYSMMTAIASVTEAEADSLKIRLGDRMKIVATGDIRFDQVVSRIEDPRVPAERFHHFGGRRVLVAGSTWPKDEKIVIHAFKRLLTVFSDIILIIAPHETDEARLKEVEDILERESITCKRLSEIWEGKPADTDAVIADGLGYLAELYGAGTVAYVGGGWTTGVHNIMEPSVWGVPVFFGPRCDNAWESEQLIGLGSAWTVKDAADLAGRIEVLLSDADAAEKAGARAASFIRDNTGASKRCARLIKETIRRE